MSSTCSAITETAATDEILGTLTALISRTDHPAHQSLKEFSIPFAKGSIVAVYPPKFHSDHPDQAWISVNGSEKKPFCWPTGDPLLHDENWRISYQPTRSLRDESAAQEAEVGEKQSVVIHFTGDSVTISEVQNPMTSNLGQPKKGHSETEWNGVHFDTVGPMDAYWDKEEESLEDPPSLLVRSNLDQA